MTIYNKVVTAKEAVSKIQDNTFVAVSGVNVAGTPMELIDAVVERYEKEGHPRAIDLINSGSNAYLYRFSPEGLLGVYYAGFPAVDSQDPTGGLTDNDKIPVFHLTQGIGSQIYRTQANNTPFLTKVGLGTYLDPKQGGGCANESARRMSAKNPIIKTVEVGGEEYLHVDLPPVTVALIRGTSADRDGNLTNEDESIKNEILPMAMAAHNNGGIVIVQVKKLLEPGQIDAADVKIPGMLVDYVVVCTDQEKWAPQNLSGVFEPGMTGHCNVARETVPIEKWKPEGSKMTLARRGALELWPGCISNVGLGIPTGIPYVAAKEDIHNMYYQSVELGAIGGYIGSADYFTGSFNATAFLNHDDMFTFIDGKGLDITFLGAGEVGEDGSVNVTRIAGLTNGSGGFVHISTNAKKIMFMLTHTVGGKPIKFVKQVEQVAFNGKDAMARGQEVMYATERAVFRLIDGKLVLIEYAPGLDIERDIIAAMGFRPEISPDAKEIPPICFNEEKMGLKEQWERKIRETE